MLQYEVSLIDKYSKWRSHLLRNQLTGSNFIISWGKWRRKEDKNQMIFPSHWVTTTGKYSRLNVWRRKLHLKFHNLVPSQNNLSPTSRCFQRMSSKCLNLTKKQVWLKQKFEGKMQSQLMKGHIGQLDHLQRMSNYFLILLNHRVWLQHNF